MGKYAPIDTTAADALAASSKSDYSWTTANFGGLFDEISGVTDADVENVLGPKPDRIAISNAIKAANPPPLASGTGLRGTAASAMYSQMIERKINDQFNAEMKAYNDRRPEVAASLIKTKEQTAFASQVDRNVAQATQNVAGAQAASARADRRMGLRTQSPELQREIQRVRAFETAANVAGAANTTRRGLRELSLQRKQIALNYGNTLAALGRQSLGTAAQAAQSRNSYNSQMTKGNPLLSALSGAVTGFITGGGPMGAVIGAGVGLAQGMS